MIYTADFVVTMDGSIIEKGAVQVVGNKIVAVGSRESFGEGGREGFRELKETVLIPGLINAHCHLELSHARNLFPSRESFTMWVSRLQKSLESLDEDDFQANVRLGAWECIRTGTTTICDIGNTGNNFQVLAKEPIRSYPVFEAIGLDPKEGTERLERQWSDILNKIVSSALPSRCQPSIGAHSAYSCSLPLLEKVKAYAEQQSLPLTLHLAEGEEERELFEKGSGRLFDFCKRKYSKFTHLKSSDPVSYLVKKNLLPNGTLAVHCNTITPEIGRILAEKKVSIVHCPRSREFFEHPTFPFEMCYNLGINICLGTDGLASNENFNLFEEMAEFRRIYPQMDCESILKMATTQAAKALGREADLGRIKQGYLADIVGLRMNHHPACDIYDEIVCEEHDVGFVLIDGVEVMA